MQTFLEYYQQKIQPQLAAIDIFLKTEEPPFAIEQMTALLCIPLEEGEKLMREEQVSLITKGVFFRFLQKGSSPLCGMFCRILSCGLPQRYTTEEVSYIFGLNLSDVKRAAEEVGEVTFSEEMLPSLFERIFISDKQYQK